ncbi:MAG: UDP-glucose 4-epimerase [Gammaproteobacteria bacterium]|jgi:UDP-glucose 4-epimerase
MSAEYCLVTGGAGYIGSHVARMLVAAGRKVVILDDLSKGFKDATLGTPLVVGDMGDQALVAQILREYKVDSVLHFAALTVVPESVADPLRYYNNNTSKARRLIECCVQAQVKNFVFSSTAAVYGIPDTDKAFEETPLQPINPYGASKMMTEMILRDTCLAFPMKHVILRYFNVAGCDPQGRIGQNTPHATLLTKVACEHAVGLRDAVTVFGTDFQTPDGTGVRDYIHVEDLAAAHLNALDYLRSDGESVTLNCGYGRGYSVREVLDAVARAAQKPLNIIESDRRPGDPPCLIAGADRVRQLLGWSPKFDDLDTIVSTSLAWERKLLISRPG